MTFSSSVNFATSGYSRNDLNSYYNESFTENTKNSTVNLSYRFSSKFQMSTTASLAQRTQGLNPFGVVSKLHPVAVADRAVQAQTRGRSRALV